MNDTDWINLIIGFIGFVALIIAGVKCRTRNEK
jgi:uncharacterized protein YciW